MCSAAQREFRQYFPKPGWVEHDADEIWASMLGVGREAMSRIGASQKYRGHRHHEPEETAIVWDKIPESRCTGAIVWQCRRTAEYCDLLKEKGLTEKFPPENRAGDRRLFSGTKIKWILDHVEGARERAERGELLFGTVETWLIWKLTKGAVHVTDYSNASRTMLFNINTLEWDREILEELQIPSSCCRRRSRPSCVYGQTDPSYFAAPSRLPGRRATSSRPCLARPASRPGRRRTPTGQAASC